MTHTYHVKYKMTSVDLDRGVDVIARSKVDAYDKAVYEKIPEIEGTLPYSAWVRSVTYNNGNHKNFNTFEGKPF